MENVAVVASNDAVLVMPLNRSQDVKKRFNILKPKTLNYYDLIFGDFS